MPDRTKNHGFQLWADGEEGWEHRSEFEKLDKRVELRGRLSDRPDDAPDGTKFVVTKGKEEGARFIRRNGSWHKLSLDAPNIRAESADIPELCMNGVDDVTVLPEGTPLNITPSAKGRVMSFQEVENSDGQNYNPFMDWYSPNGEILARLGAHSSHEHFSLYTRSDPFDGSFGSREKRLDVFAGSEFTEASWQNIEQYNVIADPQNHNQSLELVLRGATNDTNRLVFSEGNKFKYEFRHLPSFDNFNLTSPAGAVFRVHDDGGWQMEQPFDHKQNETQNTVWESDSSSNRPEEPVEGQRFFDTDLGQPIWFDGSDWVDASGDSI